MLSARRARIIAFALLSLSLIQLIGCKDGSGKPVVSAGEDSQVTKRGTIEVTARLVEVPAGAIIKRDLYNYTAILKYEVLKIHRSQPTLPFLGASVAGVTALPLAVGPFLGVSTLFADRPGQPHAGTIYVGHYNPFKPRDQAADRWVPDIGGTARTFNAGQIHRMALETPLDDFYMGGIVNQYYGQKTGPLYWAVWTNSAD